MDTSSDLSGALNHLLDAPLAVLLAHSNVSLDLYAPTLLNSLLLPHLVLLEPLTFLHLGLELGIEQFLLLIEAPLPCFLLYSQPLDQVKTSLRFFLVLGRRLVHRLVQASRDLEWLSRMLGYNWRVLLFSVLQGLL